MKKILCAALFALLPISGAFAGVFKDQTKHVSSMTFRFTGGLKMVASTTTLSTTTITLDGAAGDVAATTFTGALTGNADTASDLAANGTNCSVGQYARGVDTAGNAEGCTPAGVGDAVLNATQTWSGGNRFESYTNHIGSVTFEGVVTLSSRTCANSVAGPWTNTSFDTLAGSTVTLVVPGADTWVKVSWFAVVDNASDNQTASFRFLEDGSIIEGGATWCQDLNEPNNTGETVYCKWEYQPGAGSTDWTLQARVAGGTGQFPASTMRQFCVSTLP